MKRLVLLLLVGLAHVGCTSEVRPCKAGTAFLTLHFDGASSGADHLQVSLSLDGAPVQDNQVDRSGNASTLEIDFDTYPTGTMLVVDVIATQGGIAVGSGHGSIRLVSGCTNFALDIIGAAPSRDLAGLDLAGYDLAGPDLPQTCPVIYVAPTGSDSASTDGCSPTSAVQTIPHGVFLAGATKEVHVCAGNYAGFSLNTSTTIRGGYNCGTWTRSANFGYPNFDTSSETVLTNTNYSASHDTVHVVSGTVTLDGLVIKGAATGASGSNALHLEGATSVVSVTNCRVVGGGTSGAGSVGVEVNNGVTAELANNSINGGTGSATDSNNGSIGVDVIEAGAVRIHDNVINGGSGTNTSSVGGIGTLGLQANGNFVGANAVRNNQITAGSGTISSGAGFGSVAVACYGSVDLINNKIDGGSANGGDKGAAGVLNLGTLKAVGNTIWGGECGVTQSSQYTATGIYNSLNGQAEIANNFIHGGTGPGRVSGIIITFNKPISIHHNTIVGGGTIGEADGIYTTTNTNLSVENNLIASSGALGNGFSTTVCLNSSPIQQLRNNAFVNMNPLKVDYSGTCSSNGIHNSVPDAETVLSGIASGNIQVLESCSTASCVAVAACAQPFACMAAMFGTWNLNDNDKANLFASGWRLASTTPCELTQGGLDLRATYPVDIFGVGRTLAVSMGAYEYDGTCR